MLLVAPDINEFRIHGDDAPTFCTPKLMVPSAASAITLFIHGDDPSALSTAMLNAASAKAVAVTLYIDGDDDWLYTATVKLSPRVAVTVTWSIENDPLITPVVCTPKLTPLLPPPVLLMVR